MLETLNVFVTLSTENSIMKGVPRCIRQQPAFRMSHSMVVHRAFLTNGQL